MLALYPVTPEVAGSSPSVIGASNPGEKRGESGERSAMRITKIAAGRAPSWPGSTGGRAAVSCFRPPRSLRKPGRAPPACPGESGTRLRGWERRGGPAVAAERVAQKGEEHGVLADEQQLSGADDPFTRHAFHCPEPHFAGDRHVVGVMAGLGSEADDGVAATRTSRHERQDRPDREGQVIRPKTLLRPFSHPRLATFPREQSSRP